MHPRWLYHTARGMQMFACPANRGPTRVCPLQPRLLAPACPTALHPRRGLGNLSPHCGQAQSSWLRAAAGLGAQARALSAAGLPAHAVQPPLEPAAGPRPHLPVMLSEVLAVFEGQHLTSFFDGTLGAGGHAAEILAAHPELSDYLATDLDTEAHAVATAWLACRCPDVAVLTPMRPTDADVALATGHQSLAVQSGGEKTLGDGMDAGEKTLHRAVRVLHCDFARGVVTARRAARQRDGLSGALLDLGVSSMQLDRSGRGFSFRADGPLDMRMDGGGAGAALTAAHIVNGWTRDQLGELLREYGEEPRWRAVATRIVAAREASSQGITTTRQLAEIVATAAAGRPSTGRGSRQGRPGRHPATRTFQALRIAVNDELGLLRGALPEIIAALAPGARLAVLTFHSLEDRIVKHEFRRAAGLRPSGDEAGLPAWLLEQRAALRRRRARARGLEDEPADAGSAHDTGESEPAPPLVRLVTRKALTPTVEEMETNPRARSARLRVVEKL